MTSEESNTMQRQIIAATGNQLAIQTGEDADLFVEKLAAFINGLINNDFQNLVSLLYRLDVNEKKLKALLAENAGRNAGISIANAIIERQIQKTATRKAYNNRDNNIPESEKW